MNINYELLLLLILITLMENFLQQGEHIIQILRLSFYDEQEYSLLPQDILKLNLPKKFPCVTNLNVDRIKRKSLTQPSIGEFFTSIGYQFPFSLELITSMVTNFFQIDKACPNYLTLFTLYSYISLILDTNNLIHAPILIELLQFNMNSQVSTHFNRKQLMACTLYNIYISDEITNFAKSVQTLLPPLKSILVDHLDLPHMIFLIIIKAERQIIKNGSQKDLEYFFKLLTPIIKNSGNKYQVYMPILLSDLSNYISEFHPSVVNFLITLIDLYEKSALSHIITRLQNAGVYIFKEIEQYNVLNKWQKCSQFDLPLDDTNEFDIDFNPILYDNIPIHNFVHEELKPKYQLIASLCSKNAEIADAICASALSILYTFETNPHFIDAICAIGYIINNSQDSVSIGFVPNIIMTSSIFNPDFTIFTHPPGFSRFSAVRKIVISILLKKKTSNVLKVIQSLRVHPLLYAETIYRLIEASPCMDEYPQFVAEDMSYFMRSNDVGSAQARLALLKLIEHIGKNTITMDKFFQCRSFVLCMINMIASPRTIRFAFRQFLEYMVSVSGIGNQYVFECITNIFKLRIKEDCELLSPSKTSGPIVYKEVPISDSENSISELPVVTVKQLEDINNSRLVESKSNIQNTKNRKATPNEISIISNLVIYLDFLVELFSRCGIHIKSFSSLIPQIIEVLYKLPQCSESTTYAIRCITLLQESSKLQMCSQSELTTLVSGIQSVCKEPNTAILHELIILAAGKKLNSIKVPFAIHQPKVMNVIVKVFEHSSFFSSVLVLVDSIIKYSNENKLECHKAGLDMLLLQIIRRASLEGTLDEQTVRLLLAVFDTISSYCSSITVAHAMISLMCPIGERTLPRYFSVFLEQFRRILTQASMKPECSLPISYKGCCYVHNLPDCMFSKLAFTMWIFPQSQDDSWSRIISIGSNDHYFSVEYRNGALTCTIENGDKQWVGPMPFYIPTNEWVFLSIFVEQYKGSGDITVATFYIDDNTTQRQVFPVTPPSECLSAVIGNPRGLDGATDDLVRLGPLGMFHNISTDDIKLLRELGPRAVPSLPKPFFFFMPIHDGNSLALRSFNENITLTYTPQKDLAPSSIIDVLSTRVGLNVFTPLFSELDMVDENRESPPNLAIDIMQMLRRAFTLSSRGLQEFANQDGFAVISHLLVNSNGNNLTKGLYCEFTSLLSTISHPEVIQQLLCHICVNLELVVKSPQCVSILKNWARSLFPAFLPYVSIMIPFSKLITGMRVFFWYSKSPNGSESDERHSSIDIQEARRYLCEAAFVLSTAGLEFDDAKLLTAQILSSIDRREVLDLLSLVEAIGSNRSANFSETIYTPFLSLQVLLLANDAEVAAACLKALIGIHSCNRFSNMNEIQFIEIVLHQIPSSLCTKEFLDELLIMYEKYPVVLPLLCFVAANCNPNNLICYLFEQIKLGMPVWDYSYWAIWPAILYIKSDKEEREAVVNFIIRNGPSSWTDFIGSIDVMYRAFGKEEPFDAEHDILMKIAHHLEEDTNVLGVATFMEIVKYTIFMKPVGYKEGEMFNSMLRDAYMNNEIYLLGFFGTHYNVYRRNSFKVGDMNSTEVLRKEVNEVISADTINNNNPNNIFKNLQAGKVTENEYRLSPNIYESVGSMKTMRRFGLRFNDREWLDADVALAALSLFKKTNIDEVRDIAFIIASFYLRVDSVTTMKFASAFQDETDQQSPAMNMFKFYVFRMNKVSLLSPGLVSEFNEAAFETASVLDELVSDDPISKLGKDYIKFSILCNIRAFENGTYYIHDSFKTSIDAGRAYASTKEEEQGAIRKRWTRLWTSLTMERGPWSRTLSDTEEALFKLKRDSAICAFGVPMKVIRYQKKTQHLRQNRRRSMFMREDTEEDLLISNTSLDSNPTQLLLEGCRCEVITVSRRQNAILSVSREFIHIHKDGELPRRIKLSSIVAILIKNWAMQPTAVEITCLDGQSYLISLEEVSPVMLMEHLSELSLPRLRYGLMRTSFEEFFRRQNFTEKWVNRRMSNFQYLMKLNNFSGRSFNSVQFYPVFPWILADYSGGIDWTNKAAFRDLSKPVGTLDKARLAELALRARNHAGSFLYDTAYSTPGAVTKFLGRLEPFASMGGECIQSVIREFRMASMALGNYNELTPEFFCLPEAFKGVELPKWALNEYDFVYLHRKLLESDIVSGMLNRWIDLIWGVEQRGPMNTFAPELYLPSRRTDVACVRGQIPMQLFTRNHPERQKANHIIFNKSGCSCRFSEQQVVGASIMKLSSGEVGIVSVTSVGVIRMVRFGITGSGTVQLVDEEQGTNRQCQCFEELYDINGDAEIDIRAVTSGSFVLRSRGGRELFEVGIASGSARKRYETQTSISCVGVSGDYVVIADNDAVITVFSVSDLSNPLFSLQAYASFIKCVAISSAFHTIACGSKDSAVIIGSLTSRRMSRVVDIAPFVATQVEVTPSWGFVVAFAKGLSEGRAAYKFIVMSASGDVLKEEGTGYPVRQMTSFFDESGFDHVVFADSKNRVFIFEAYYPATVRQIYVGSKTILGLSYWQQGQKVVISTSDGYSHFVYPFL